MEDSVICHRLDLVVRTVDTSTGFVVEERNVRFRRNGELLKPIYRGSGNFVFVNCGREDCELEIEMYGYEPCTLPVCYKELDKQVPITEAFLIPSENVPGGLPVITLAGKLPGLTQLEAVSLSLPPGRVSEFDERRRILKLFGDSKVDTDKIYYGLVHTDRQDFEPIKVIKDMPDGAVKLEKPLAEPFSVNDPVARIVYGRVCPDGSYVLRVRDAAESLPYMIRYVVQGETKFKTVDLRRADEAGLE